MASCSNELDVPVNQAVLGGGTTPLSINVLANPTTKAQITGDKLPNESKIGVTLIATDAADGKYDTYEYKNIYYSTTDGATWKIDNTKSILLSATDGTVYAYYPYDANETVIEHISINATDGTDYMYAEPVSGIKNSNAAAQLTMKHALSVVKFTIQGASTNAYTGAGVISNVKLEGATMGSEGYMNIKTQTVSASAGAMTYTSPLKLNPADVGETNQAQVFAVPTGTQSAIKFTVTMDGQDYTATTGNVTLASGQQYSYTLNMSSTGLTVNTVTVTPWGDAPATDPIDTQLSTTTLTDGVYAIKADGTLVAPAEANEGDVAAVGFVLKGKKYQVAKVDAKQTENGEEYAHYVWWDNTGYTNLAVLPDYDTADGTRLAVGLPAKDGSFHETMTEEYQLTDSWTEWSDYISTASLSDFNGQDNTNKIIAAQTENDVVRNFTVGKTVTDFRNNTDCNEGKRDWFLPAEGELAFMFLKETELNELLQKAGGNSFVKEETTGAYFSSTENNDMRAWGVSFLMGSVQPFGKYGYAGRVRLIRLIN